MSDPSNYFRESSVPIDGGGDSHFHPYGRSEEAFVVTTRIPVGEGVTVDIHDNPFADYSDFKVVTNY